jgi:hypothetical protein
MINLSIYLTILLFLSISSVFFWIRYTSKNYTPIVYDISNELLVFGSALSTAFKPAAYLDLQYPNNYADLSILQPDTTNIYHLVL